MKQETRGAGLSVTRHLDATIKIAFVMITAATLSGCLASSGSIGQLSASPSLVRAPGTAIISQCAPNTFCGADVLALAMPMNVAATGQVTATGAGTILGATQFSAVTNPATGQLTTVTVNGAISAANIALTYQATGVDAGSYTGVLPNGLTVDVTSYGTPNGFNGTGVPATAASGSAGLSYSDFGDWSIDSTATGAQTEIDSVWAGGSYLTTRMPRSGSATYTGITIGTSMANNAGTWNHYDMNGNISLTANFVRGGGTITGNITGITVINDNVAGAPQPAGSFNDIALNGRISGNGFTATATAGAVPAGNNPGAIAANTVGSAGGHFYGPTANEITGVWNMQTASVQVVGSFGAKR